MDSFPSYLMSLRDNLMKNYKIKVPIFMMLFGWLLAGFGFATTLGYPISTISFCLGLSLAFFGFILFVLRVKK